MLSLDVDWIISANRLAQRDWKRPCTVDYFRNRRYASLSAAEGHIAAKVKLFDQALSVALLADRLQLIQPQRDNLEDKAHRLPAAPGPLGQSLRRFRPIDCPQDLTPPQRPRSAIQAQH